MNAGRLDAALDLGRPTQPSRRLSQWWSLVSALLLASIFAQAIFAGLMLSGVGWAYTAHEVNAIALIAATLLAGLVSAVTLWRVAHGRALALTLLALAVVIFLQTGIGRSSVAGANLMWVHIPLGVALVGLAARALAVARQLGRVDGGAARQRQG
jgi:hypothetical protein